MKAPSTSACIVSLVHAHYRVNHARTSAWKFWNVAGWNLGHCTVSTVLQYNSMSRFQWESGKIHEKYEHYRLARWDSQLSVLLIYSQALLQLFSSHPLLLMSCFWLIHIQALQFTDKNFSSFFLSFCGPSRHSTWGGLIPANGEPRLKKVYVNTEVKAVLHEKVYGSCESVSIVQGVASSHPYIVQILHNQKRNSCGLWLQLCRPSCFHWYSAWQATTYALTFLEMSPMTLAIRPLTHASLLACALFWSKSLAELLCLFYI